MVLTEERAFFRALAVLEVSGSGSDYVYSMRGKGIGATAQDLGINAAAFVSFVSGVALSVGRSHVLFAEDVPGLADVVGRPVHLQ